MRNLLLLACVLLPLAACQKTDTTAATGPDVTVLLRDGTRVSGAVVQSSAAQITVKTPDGSTRTFEMRDVRTVDYGDLGPPPATPARSRAHSDGAPTPPRYHPPESHISTKTFSLPAGTRIEVRTDESIDSAIAVEGQTYAAEIYRDIVDAAGDVVLPQGANAKLAIRSASKGGRIAGTSDLVVDLAAVSVGGRQYAVVSSDVEKRGKQGLGANKRTGEYVGGTAAVGAIIGAIAGHGKGAAIGAASGAGAGAAAEILTKGGSVKIPAETLLTFQLEQPLSISARR